MIYREALRNGNVAGNPARLVRMRHENNARLRFLTKAEEASIRTAIQKHVPYHEPAFDLALHTGMRLGEQFSLTWDQVHLERCQIMLNMTKNGSRRAVPLNSTAMAALKRIQADSGHVFRSKYGEPLQTPRAWFEKALRRSGVEGVTWHTLRHTFVSRLVVAGVHLKQVQELAGHKTIQMTARYAHLAPEHQLSAVEVLVTEQPRSRPTATRTATKRKSGNH